MGLLFTKINPKKRPSLTEVKPPHTRKDDPTTLTAKQPTREEIAYSRMVADNPALDLLVESLDLVSISTGKRIERVDISQADNSCQERNTAPVEISQKVTVSAPRREDKDLKGGDIDKLRSLAKQCIPTQRHYSREEVVTLIVEGAKVDRDRAEKGFKLMIQAGVIETALKDRFYLAGSTPF